VELWAESRVSHTLDEPSVAIAGEEVLTFCGDCGNGVCGEGEGSGHEGGNESSTHGGLREWVVKQMKKKKRLID